MDASGRHKLEMKIFEQVCDLPPEERATALGELCAEDASLRQRVEAMLAIDGTDDRRLDNVDSQTRMAQLIESVTDSTSDGDMPERIAGYRIIRKVGAGGMGVIFEAEQESPRRRVALKVLRPGLFGRDALKRFRHEAQVLGHLQHAGIAQIHEAGMAETGNGNRQPYFAMELVEGEPLDQFCRSKNLGARPKLELIARVCDAVQHAHQKGVIHRDLKPNNVLVVATEATSSVGTHDPLGQPKVLDFGIARVTDADIQTMTVQTEVGQLVGTLAYMSPEQMAGNSEDIDTRSDVYALGVMLYELLAGKRPHDFTGRSIVDAARSITETDPQPLGQLDRALRGDVETIVAKALEKDRERRYGSAAELAADIRRHLHDQPIDARPASRLYQLRKFSRRNTGLVAGVAAAILALSIGLVFSTISARRARAATLLAESESRRVKESKDDLELLSGFQGAIISGANMQQMGDSILAELDKLVDDDERKDLLRTALQDVNPASLARQVVDGNLLSPASRAATEEFADRPNIEADVRAALSKSYFNLGMHEQSLREAMTGLALRREYQGNDHPDTVRVIGEVAAILSNMERFADAESYVEEELRLLRATLPEDDKFVLRARDRMVVVLTGLGRLDEAIQASEAVVADATRVCSPDDSLLPHYRQHLARLYSRTQQFEKALALIRVLLEQNERMYGVDHERTLICRSHLAGTLARLERYDEAEPVYVKLQQQAESRYGESDPRAIGLLGSLARVRASSGKREAALATFNQLLDRQRQAFPEDHPAIVETIEAIQWLESGAPK